jgi:hypothetical protein
VLGYVAYLVVQLATFFKKASIGPQARGKPARKSEIGMEACDNRSHARNRFSRSNTLLPLVEDKRERARHPLPASDRSPERRFRGGPPSQARRAGLPLQPRRHTLQRASCTHYPQHLLLGRSCGEPQAPLSAEMVNVVGPAKTPAADTGIKLEALAGLLSLGFGDKSMFLAPRRPAEIETDPRDE